MNPIHNISSNILPIMCCFVPDIYVILMCVEQYIFKKACINIMIVVLFLFAINDCS
uniref:Uncharacterized protein n=1 Tax=Octopus bimaculoides TaxID=37653 RepID=A0A0L8GIQ6_OCTBM